MIANRKVLAGLLLVALVMAACASPATPLTVATATAQHKTISVGFSSSNAGWPWYASFTRTLEKRATEKGWELTVLSANGDVATQMNQIDDMISKKVDYMLVGPLDATAVIPGLKKAQDAGIKVIIVGNLPDPAGMQYVAATVVPDDGQLGQGSAELMVEALKGGPGKIVVVDGLAGQPAVTLRWAKMRPVFAAAKIEVLASEPADWDVTKAIKVTEDLITRYPNVDGVFSLDGAMTPGVVQVVQEAGLKVPVVGLGGTQTELQAIKDGKLYGTTCMSPGSYASSAVDVIQAMIDGTPFEKTQIVPTPKITLANINDCPGDW